MSSNDFVGSSFLNFATIWNNLRWKIKGDHITFLKSRRDETRQARKRRATSKFNFLATDFWKTAGDRNFRKKKNFFQTTKMFFWFQRRRRRLKQHAGGGQPHAVTADASFTCTRLSLTSCSLLQTNRKNTDTVSLTAMTTTTTTTEAWLKQQIQSQNNHFLLKSSLLLLRCLWRWNSVWPD